MTECYKKLANKKNLVDCIKMDSETLDLAKYFKLHIERGISHLSGTNFIKNLDDLLGLVIEGK